ncbi:uncharacterized protein BXZ73DRAFT_106148 [Epithele typhae]|uniref:uncharacterized protein n=1 Tax=Epithele typhae TaxID=378194 RepID=UPI0020087FCE|nr:uncharacterized protein BXZ73DRAFT_106148 [Epithele typhae]KAH9915600.1 hypothetical protein BXZ73DRAFT_106148 [Epithele typhae]
MTQARDTVLKYLHDHLEGWSNPHEVCRDGTLHLVRASWGKNRASRTGMVYNICRKDSPCPFVVCKVQLPHSLRLECLREVLAATSHHPASWRADLIREIHRLCSRTGEPFIEAALLATLSNTADNPTPSRLGRPALPREDVTVRLFLENWTPPTSIKEQGKRYKNNTVALRWGEMQELRAAISDAVIKGIIGRNSAFEYFDRPSNSWKPKSETRIVLQLHEGLLVRHKSVQMPFEFAQQLREVLPPNVPSLLPPNLSSIPHTPNASVGHSSAQPDGSSKLSRDPARRQDSPPRKRRALASAPSPTPAPSRLRIRRMVPTSTLFDVADEMHAPMTDGFWDALAAEQHSDGDNDVDYEQDFFSDFTESFTDMYAMSDAEDTDTAPSSSVSATPAPASASFTSSRASMPVVRANNVAPPTVAASTHPTGTQVRDPATPTRAPRVLAPLPRTRTNIPTVRPTVASTSTQVSCVPATSSQTRSAPTMASSAAAATQAPASATAGARSRSPSLAASDDSERTLVNEPARPASGIPGTSFLNPIVIGEGPGEDADHAFQVFDQTGSRDDPIVL